MENQPNLVKPFIVLCIGHVPKKKNPVNSFDGIELQYNNHGYILMIKLMYYAFVTHIIEYL